MRASSGRAIGNTGKVRYDVSTNRGMIDATVAAGLGTIRECEVTFFYPHLRLKSFCGPSVGFEYSGRIQYEAKP
jgi:hypothetical protein